MIFTYIRALTEEATRMSSAPAAPSPAKATLYTATSYVCDRETRELGEDYPELKKIVRAFRLLEHRLTAAQAQVARAAVAFNRDGLQSCAWRCKSTRAWAHCFAGARRIRRSARRQDCTALAKRRPIVLPCHPFLTNRSQRRDTAASTA
jgi:hypothetical protein